MLNKLLVLAIIINISIQKEKPKVSVSPPGPSPSREPPVAQEYKNTQGKNVKTIKKNEEAINKSDKLIKQHENMSEKEFKKIENLHNNIKKNGINLKHTEYNKLIKRYSGLINQYNKNRNGFCAKLPKIWALADKDKSELTPLEKECKNWFFHGEVLGRNVGNAIFTISVYKFWANWFEKKDKLGCVMDVIHHSKTKDKKVVHFKKCYKDGYYSAIRETLNYLREKEKNAKVKKPVMKKPFKSFKQKTKEIKKSMESMKKTLLKKK